jgi:predicted Rossmann fold flavoprotein
MKKNTTIIIGGGPAGIMAAINAGYAKTEVMLIEKNEYLGRKLLITGGGRCNLTNACPTEDFISHYSKTGNFLRDAFKAFDNNDLISFFVERGLAVRTEPDGRVFPVTDKASSVLDVLLEELNALNVDILSKTSVKEVVVSKDTVAGVLCKNGTRIKADKVIIATGGLSYKTTGSTGDGLNMAEKLGHKIVPLKPALVALALEGTVPGKLEGVSIDDVRLTYRSGRKKVVSQKGSIIFTSDGISGPVTLSSSSKAVDWLGEGEEVSLEIDILPELAFQDAEGLIIKKLSESSGKEIKTVLKEFAPARFCDILLDLSNIPQDKKAGQLASKDRKSLLELLKGLKFNIAKTVLFEKARITRGGISVKEIDPRTMESRKVKGLFFAGEMIDIDGDCGGFNLQAAFSTGWLAGRSSAE